MKMYKVVVERTMIHDVFVLSDDTRDATDLAFKEFPKNGYSRTVSITEIGEPKFKVGDKVVISNPKKGSLGSEADKERFVSEARGAEAIILRVQDYLSKDTGGFCYSTDWRDSEGHSYIIDENEMEFNEKTNI